MPSVYDGECRQELLESLWRRARRVNLQYAGHVSMSETRQCVVHDNRSGDWGTRIAHSIVHSIDAGANLAVVSRLVGVVRQLVAGEGKLGAQQSDQNQPLEG